MTETDKEVYQQVFEALQHATEQSILNAPVARWYETWSTKFGRNGGIQGHRPVDLWSSVINVEFEVFGNCPQVYVIASELGFEIGFAVTIHEDDYYNATVKARQRAITPVLYRKLPDPGSTFVSNLDAELSEDGVWKFGTKARQHSGPDFGSLENLIGFLKSPDSSNRGGGSIYRIVEPNEIISSEFDLNVTFSQAVNRFTPLMRLLVPNRGEQIELRDQEVVYEFRAGNSRNSTFKYGGCSHENFCNSLRSVRDKQNFERNYLTLTMAVAPLQEHQLPRRFKLPISFRIVVQKQITCKTAFCCEQTFIIFLTSNSFRSVH